MARIRTIKPEWLADEKLKAASDSARMLSIALIVLADDYGNGDGSELCLAGQVWGADEDAASALEHLRTVLAELEELGYVQLYRVSRQRYYHLANWSRHQRVDKPGKPLVPGPERADDAPRESREGLANASRTPREVLAPDRDPDPDPDPDQSDDSRGSRGSRGSRDGRERPAGWGSLSKANKATLSRHIATAERLWSLQEDLRRDTGARGQGATAERLLRIAERLEAGATADECEAVLRHYHGDARRTGERKWFNGETNWRRDNFDRALGQVGTAGISGGQTPGEYLDRLNADHANKGATP